MKVSCFDPVGAASAIVQCLTLLAKSEPKYLLVVRTPVTPLKFHLNILSYLKIKYRLLMIFAYMQIGM